MTYQKIVDADGHVLEPMDLWDNYLEPRYRDRGVKWRVDDQGVESILVDNQVILRGATAALGGIGGYPSKDGDRGPLFALTSRYLDGAPPGSMDPHQRIQVLDDEKIDVALLYPTVGLLWEERATDPDLALALCRAYNNWLVDFCRPYPDRLVPVAHVSILDIPAAVEEMRRTAKLGAKGFFFRPDLVEGRTLAHPDYAPIWATAQDLDLPVAPHVVVRTKNEPLYEWMRSMRRAGSPPGVSRTMARADEFMFGFAYLMLPIQAAFTAMVYAGVFDRFPRLKYVILEAGSGWIAHWLERLDNKYKVSKSFAGIKEKPSTYFQRQCWISVEPDEETTEAMVELLGEDKFVWASDFPHADAEFGAVDELCEHIAKLPAEAQRKILGGNAAQVYSLPA